MYRSNMSDNEEMYNPGSMQQMELEDVDAEFLALRKLYMLLQTNGNCNILDDRALSLLKSLLDAAAEKLLETHSKILAAQLHTSNAQRTTKPESHPPYLAYIPETLSTTSRAAFHNEINSFKEQTSNFPNYKPPTISTNQPEFSHLHTHLTTQNRHSSSEEESPPKPHPKPSTYHPKPPRPHHKPQDYENLSKAQHGDKNCHKCGRRKAHQEGKSVNSPYSSLDTHRLASTEQSATRSYSSYGGYSSGESVSQSRSGGETTESSGTEYSLTETDSADGRMIRPSAAEPERANSKLKGLKNRLALIFHHHHHHHHHQMDDRYKKKNLMKNAQKARKDREGHEQYVEQPAEAAGRAVATTRVPPRKQLNTLVSGLVKHARASRKSRKSKDVTKRSKAPGEGKKLGWLEKRMTSVDGAGKRRARVKKSLLLAHKSTES